MSKSLNFLTVVLITALASFFYWVLYRSPIIGVDDANIYFVYAKNLAQGYGFVYNPNGELVEGFSSISWVLLCTILYLISSNFEYLIIILNIIFISCALYLLISHFNKVKECNKYWSFSTLLFLSIIIFSVGYIDWTILTLMETGFWSFLLLLSFINISDKILFQKNNNFSIIVCIPLLIITRPEGLLWAFSFVFLLFINSLLSLKNFIQAAKQTWLYLLVFFTSLFTLFVWRIYVFGYLFPNTYYAKVSTNRWYNLTEGIKYLWHFCYSNPIIYLLILLIINSLFTISFQIYNKGYAHINKVCKFQLIVVFVSIINLIIPIYTGGDHFGFFRFYQPALPIMILLILNFKFYLKDSLLINVEGNKWQNSVLKIGILFLPFFLPMYGIKDLVSSYLHQEDKTKYSKILHEFEIATESRNEGQFLNKLFSNIPKPSIGVISAGGFAYVYDGEVIDLMGLNNTIMAHAIKNKIGLKNHAAFDKATFYKLNPSLFLGAVVENSNVSMSNQLNPEMLRIVFKNIIQDQKFKDKYEAIVISDTTKNLHYATFLNRKYKKSISPYFKLTAVSL